MSEEAGPKPTDEEKRRETLALAGLKTGDGLTLTVTEDGQLEVRPINRISALGGLWLLSLAKGHIAAQLSEIGIEPKELH